ncbi:hypothetical protein AVEN_233265-1 [Araneus ventricosus]|uniref:Uncharacterized protein n=1 Tax=Araneus ventricosus TaxID=182803 RepID=A0A4Y2PBW2_ARAVE|nr:hypothetical protein AVEN_233265-1 [Araneus ventricosus]
MFSICTQLCQRKSPTLPASFSLLGIQPSYTSEREVQIAFSRYYYAHFLNDTQPPAARTVQDFKRRTQNIRTHKRKQIIPITSYLCWHVETNGLHLPFNDKSTDRYTYCMG